MAKNLLVKLEEMRWSPRERMRVVVGIFGARVHGVDKTQHRGMWVNLRKGGTIDSKWDSVSPQWPIIHHKLVVHIHVISCFSAKLRLSKFMVFGTSQNDATSSQIRPRLSPLPSCINLHIPFHDVELRYKISGVVLMLGLKAKNVVSLALKSGLWQYYCILLWLVHSSGRDYRRRHKSSW